MSTSTIGRVVWSSSRISRHTPQCGQVRVEARYRAAGGAQASGDLYDVVRTAFGVRAIIGDVSGHGPKAADVAADILENFRELAQHEIGIAGIAFRLDGLLSHRSGPLAEWFVTAVIVQIPADSANVELVGCGHPPPLLLRPGRPPGMCELVPALPLGLQELDECWYSSTWVALSGGDALLFYTDGIVEARDKKLTSFRIAHDLRTIRTHLTTVTWNLMVSVNRPNNAVKRVRNAYTSTCTKTWISARCSSTIRSNITRIRVWKTVTVLVTYRWPSGSLKLTGFLLVMRNR